MTSKHIFCDYSHELDIMHNENFPLDWIDSVILVLFTGMKMYISLNT